MTQQVQTSLKARTRDDNGKSSARGFRRQGLIPAVMYGRGFDSESLLVEEHELSLLLGRISAENTLIDLAVEGGPARKVLIRALQRHPWKSSILHVDFFRINVDEEIKVAVPVHAEGEAVGVKIDGGILQQHRHEIQVSCLPTEIPGHFVVDVSDLRIGDSVYVADIDVGETTMIDDPEAIVCTVIPPTVLVVEEAEEEEEEEEGLEPEVIGEAEATGEEGAESAAEGS